MIRPRVRTAAQPRFLHASAIELPDTVIEAVKQETLHLYDNASEVIARGIGLPLDEILSDHALEDIAPSRGTPIGFDIDEAYNENVKGLFAEIVEFISRAQANMTPEQYDELFGLRSAGRDIVEVIKDTKHLQKNLSRFLTSEQAVVREEYAKIRRNLAKVLRTLHEVRQQGHDSAAILSLDALKGKMKKYDRKLNRRMNTLIRDHHLSGPVTISLMNDSGYAYQVTKNLVKMGAVLFSTADHGLREAERSVALDESEMAEALGESQNANPQSHDEPH